MSYVSTGKHRVSGKRLQNGMRAVVAPVRLSIAAALVVVGSLFPLLSPLPSAFAENPATPGMAPGMTPANAGTAKKPLTKEEEERREWISHWCHRAKKDPKCKFYTEKELGKAMREVEKSAHDLGEDEYCAAHGDDTECQGRKRKQEEAEKLRKMKELLRYCRQNPDAPRCTDELSDEDAATVSGGDSTKKSSR